MSNKELIERLQKLQNTFPVAFNDVCTDAADELEKLECEVDRLHDIEKRMKRADNDATKFSIKASELQARVDKLETELSKHNDKLSNWIRLQKFPEHYPEFTENRLRWLWRFSEHNGYAKAFRKVGRAIYVNVDLLAQCIDEK